MYMNTLRYETSPKSVQWPICFRTPVVHFTKMAIALNLTRFTFRQYQRSLVQISHTAHNNTYVAQ